MTQDLKTPQEIQDLKDNWLADPCWDIEDTEGFEAHREELLAFHNEHRAEWDRERKLRKERRRIKVMEATGVCIIGNENILDSLSTWSEIENDCARYEEDAQTHLQAALVRATLLQAAQLKRIADALEDMQDGDSLAQSVRLNMTQETSKFIDWVKNNKDENFEVRPEQVKILELFFALQRGCGKTTLIEYLKAYDR